MRSKILLLVILIITSVTKVSAKRGISIIYNDGEDVEKILDLPHRDEFMIQAEDGKWYHANLGIMHEQFSIFWIPIFNYGTERYVLYTDTKIGKYDFTYADLDSEDIAYLQSEFGGISSNPELPFWDAWGGKLLVLAIIGLIIFIKSK